MTAPLMPKATAVWLVENTTLTFRQIAKFCEIHELEIQAIADGDVAYNIVGLSPINNNQLTWEEIHRCEADSHADLVANVLENNVKERNAKAKKLLTPTQRSEKPAAILWILQQFPNIIDSQIAKLLGTTKPTIAKVRNKGYEDLKPKNPMTLGLCDEISLEKAVSVSEALSNPKPKTKKKPAKKTKAAAKKKTVKTKTTKTAAKKTAPKSKAVKTKTATKKTAAKKTVTKAKTAKAATTKTTAKKTTKTKTAAKKPVAKKAATKTKAATTKTAAKKTTKTKTAAKKTAAKKTITKAKPAKTATKKTTAKKTTKKATAKKK